MKPIAAALIVMALASAARAECSRDDVMNKMIALQQLNVKLQGEVPLDPRKDPAAMERAVTRIGDFSARMAEAGPLLAAGKYNEACAIYDKIAGDFHFSFATTPSLTMDDLRKDGDGCDVTEVAKRMVALMADFQKAYDAGKFTYERQRQFSKDSETASALSTTDPAKACLEIQALREKYGL